VNLEALLESPQGFSVPLTPVQRAIARIMTGEPLKELADNAEVAEMLGGVAAVAALPSTAPNMLVLGAAVRCGKSTLVAAKALRNAYLGDCSGLAPGEIPRVAILSVDLDKSRETFSKIVGALTESPVLSQLLVKGKPPGKDSVLVRNKSGRTVEIKVVAGARAGKTLVSRWLLGFIADEAPRMVGAEDGVINLDDALSAIIARMRPGAQIDLVGSPWAPSGTFYELVTKRHGKPGADMVVMLATGPMLRPALYTPEYCERIRLADDRAYEADVMARFSDSESSLLPSVDVAAAVRTYTEQRAAPGWEYVAVMDPATRGNGWTLVVIGVSPAGEYEIVLAREWIGSRSKPLKASVVMLEMGQALAPYDVDDVYTDQWGFDILKDVAELVDAGFGLLQVDRDDEIAGKRIVQMLTEHRLALPDNKQLRQDLVGIKRKPRQGGGSQIVLPTTADGRHCDYGAAVLLAMQVLPTTPVAELPAMSEEDQYCLAMQLRQSEGATNAAARRLMGM
jgi:hypothetical protein